MPRRLLISPSTPGWSAQHVGTNINGPSMVKAPNWLRGAPGRYLLYFGHHQGQSIRLAYADALEGPWRIHAGGTLRLEQTRFNHHIASPDLHLDHANRRLVMYFHGCTDPGPGQPWPKQQTCVAFSENGLDWCADDTPLCASYLRVFEWRGRRYGITMPGVFHRFDGGWTQIETRPARIAGVLCGIPDDKVHEDRKARHFAAQVKGDRLDLYFSRAGDAPEHILRCSIELSDDWTKWSPGPVVSALKPEYGWEGADLPIEPSQGGRADAPVHQLRDPAVFHEDDGRVWLIYSTAGESGLGITEIHPNTRESTS